MFFNVQEARNQLLNHGQVYTIRPKLRKTGRDIAVTGSYYHKERLGEIQIEFVMKVDQERYKEELQPYLIASGFSDIGSWWDEAKKDEKGSGYLFNVCLSKEAGGSRIK